MDGVFVLVVVEVELGVREIVEVGNGSAVSDGVGVAVASGAPFKTALSPLTSLWRSSKAPSRKAVATPGAERAPPDHDPP
jgi:hypothetical protein